jgi:lipoate-protein ligase A
LFPRLAPSAVWPWATFNSGQRFWSSARRLLWTLTVGSCSLVDQYNDRMADVWRLIIDQPAHGDWNMAVDEAILEHSGRGLVPPTIRLYAWSPPCLSLGYAQPYDDVASDRLHRTDWLVVRRPTGGRAILHADELTYSLAAPSSNPVVRGSLLESYNRIARALLRAVRSLGLNAEIKPAVGAERGSTNPVCFEAPSAHEITVNGKKLVGSAQARRREGVLQHGSLPLTGALSRITRVLHFADEEARAAAAARLQARATTVESELRRSVTWDEAAASFVESFELELGIRLASASLSEAEIDRATRLVGQKYACPDWTERMHVCVSADLAAA